MLSTKNHQDTRFRLRQDVLICLFLVTATLAVYWQVQHFDFVNFDDNDYVYENQHVQSGLTTENIVWAFTAVHSANWHPLAWLSHMLDCQLYGLNPGRHHLTNLLIHIFNTLLLFSVFQKMTRNLWQSAFVAALFALHPCNVGSVAWIAERKNILSTFFWLLTMWSYVRYVENPGTRKYLAVVLCFILGLMSKPMLVTLPFVLLLLDYWPLNRLQISRSTAAGSRQKSTVLRLVWEKIPLFVLVVISCAITVYAQKHGGLVVSLDEIPFNTRIANALVAYVQYIGKLIYPVKLAAVYPHPGMLPWWQITGALVLLVAISSSAIRALRQKPYFVVGWLWFLGTLVPVIGIVQVGNQAMADRYTYIPFVGLFIMLAWGVPELAASWPHRKKWLAALSAFILVALTALTWRQTHYWQNSIVLFEHNLAVTADHCAIRISLGDALEKTGRTTEAIEQYLQALRLNPNFEEAHNNLGIALDKQGRLEEAVQHYLQALRISPNSERTHNNLGNALLKMGKPAEAVRHFNESLRLNPKFVEAYNSLGTALARMGKVDEAIVQFQTALQINPGLADTHVNLGGALLQTGRIDQAIVHFRKALKIKPDIPEVYINLGVALAHAGQLEQAVTHFRKALQLEPDSSEAQSNLDQAVATLEKIDREIEYIQKQLALSPQDPTLHFSLGNMYKMKGQSQKAKDHYARALSLQPEFPEALYELAKLYIRQGEYENALAVYHKMIAFMPHSPVGYYNIACIYARRNRPADAVAWLQKAVARGLDDWHHIKTDKDLDNIRNFDQYKAFIKGH